MTALNHVATVIGYITLTCAAVVVPWLWWVLRHPKPILNESYEVPPLREVSLDEALTDCNEAVREAEAITVIAAIDEQTGDL